MANRHLSDPSPRRQCGECLGALAHRLSQPLTALRGTLELALRTKLSAAESRAALEQAFELTDLVVHLVKALGELADAATVDAPATRLSLQDLVKQAVEDLQGLTGARGIQVRFGTSLEAPVWGPPDRLREVIMRLLCLVVQRSPDQGEIRLALSSQPAGGSASLLIADQCAHPAPGEFEFPAEGTPTLGCLFAEAAKQHALEWAIVSVLVESLGGTLQVMPCKPQGCCFVLKLPLADLQD